MGSFTQAGNCSATSALTVPAFTVSWLGCITDQYHQLRYRVISLILAAACDPAPPRSDTTSAASTSYDGGSCSAGTPRTLPGHDHPPPELAITGPAANTPAGSCQPGLARTRSADYDLPSSPAAARRGRSLDPVCGAGLPARLYRARLLPRRRAGTAVPRPRVMAARTGHAVPDRMGERMGPRRQPAPRPAAPAPRSPRDRLSA